MVLNTKKNFDNEEDAVSYYHDTIRIGSYSGTALVYVDTNGKEKILKIFSDNE
jgi:hypothetical protein